MLDIAIKVLPQDICLVPERREERTTEGGLDVITHYAKVAHAVKKLSDAGIRVSLFIAPDLAMIDAAVKLGAPVIELHTGTFADADSDATQEFELTRIEGALHHAKDAKLIVNAGHGLHYHNVHHIARMYG